MACSHNTQTHSLSARRRHSKPQNNQGPRTHTRMNAAPRYQMHLHNLKSKKIVDYTETTVADGPRHQETWTATIIVYQPTTGKMFGQYLASNATKQGAREQASAQALCALGVDLCSLR